MYARAYLEAVKQFEPELLIYAPRGTLVWEMGRSLGFRMAAEILVDLSYDDDGNWLSERNKQARSPEEVAERALMVAQEQLIPTVSGKKIPAAADTICCHGDSPNAAEVVAKIKEVYQDRGILLKAI